MQHQRPAAISVAELENSRVDKFARGFVGDMLDFNPDTYRISQIHAMASMSPELMKRYWTETQVPSHQQSIKSISSGHDADDHKSNAAALF